MAKTILNTDSLGATDGQVLTWDNTASEWGGADGGGGGGGDQPALWGYASYGLTTSIGTNYTGFGGLGVVNASETNQKFAITVAGTISDFGIYIGTNAKTANTVFTLRKNGADTTVTFTVAGGATGWIKDLTNTATVAAGDLMSVKIVTNDTGSAAGTAYSHTFTPS